MGIGIHCGEVVHGFMDPANLKVPNSKDASTLVRRRYRKGWEVDGL